MKAEVKQAAAEVPTEEITLRFKEMRNRLAFSIDHNGELVINIKVPVGVFEGQILTSDYEDYLRRIGMNDGAIDEAVRAMFDTINKRQAMEILWDLNRQP